MVAICKMYYHQLCCCLQMMIFCSVNLIIIPICTHIHDTIMATRAYHMFSLFTILLLLFRFFTLNLLDISEENNKLLSDGRRLSNNGKFPRYFISTVFLNIHIYRVDFSSNFQVFMVINRYTKRGDTCLILPSNKFHVDLTICMDISPNPGPESSTRKCDNNNGDSVNISNRNRCQNINIAHLNARSIKNREHYILARNLVRENNLDILTISELWLNNSVSDIEIEFPGYSLFRLDRDNKVGGGICVYVNSNFKCSRLNELSYISDSGFHQLWLKV
jgi:hypothetical protein